VRVLGEVHDAHAPASQLAEDSVMRNGFPDHVSVIPILRYGDGGRQGREAVGWRGGLRQVREWGKCRIARLSYSMPDLILEYVGDERNL
jgi:hypothetical protein